MTTYYAPTDFASTDTPVIPDFCKRLVYDLYLSLLHCFDGKAEDVLEGFSDSYEAFTQQLIDSRIAFPSSVYSHINDFLDDEIEPLIMLMCDYYSDLVDHSSYQIEMNYDDVKITIMDAKKAIKRFGASYIRPLLLDNRPNYSGRQSFVPEFRPFTDHTLHTDHYSSEP